MEEATRWNSLEAEVQAPALPLTAACLLARDEPSLSPGFLSKTEVVTPPTETVHSTNTSRARPRMSTGWAPGRGVEVIVWGFP